MRVAWSTRCWTRPRSTALTFGYAGLPFACVADVVLKARDEGCDFGVAAEPTRQKRQRVVFILFGKRRNAGAPLTDGRRATEWYTTWDDISIQNAKAEGCGGASEVEQIGIRDIVLA